MKPFAFFLISLMGTTRLFGFDIGQNTLDLASEDYELRQEALNHLHSAVAEASHPDADAGKTQNLVSAILERIVDTTLPEQTRIYYIRSLARVASPSAVEDLIRLIGSEDRSGLIVENAFATLAQMPGEEASAALLEAFKSAPDSQADAFWAAFAVRADASIAPAILKLLRSGEKSLTEQALLSISRFGDEALAEYLYDQWKTSDTGNRDSLAFAILNTARPQKDRLKSLVKKSDSPAVIIPAFRQWVQTDESEAYRAYTKLVQEKPGMAPVLMKCLSDAGSDSLWSKLYEDIEALDDEALMTLITATAEQGRSEFETQVLSRLNHENPSVVRVAIQCLGFIGGPPSTAPLIAKMESEQEEIRETVLSALARLDDPELDERMLSIARELGPSAPNAITLLAARNSPGALEWLNSQLGRELASDTREAVLDALVAIGDEITCRRLALLCLSPELADPRDFQLTLKRLTLRLERAEALWQSVYSPAIHLAAEPAIQARFIVLLDAISTPEVLEKCIGWRESDNESIAQAAYQALIRWRSMDVCDYWLGFVDDEETKESERKQAIQFINRTLTAEYLNEGDTDAARKAAKLFLATENETLRGELLESVEKLGQWPGMVFKWQLDPYLSISAFSKEIEALVEEE